MATSCEVIKKKLLESGLTEESLTILEEEMILDEHIFKSLQREHVYKLLQSMKVGQHALLVKFWEQLTTEAEVKSTSSRVRQCNVEFFYIYYTFITS